MNYKFKKNTWNNARDLKIKIKNYAKPKRKHSAR